jgi:hypothetical protein
MHVKKNEQAPAAREPRFRIYWRELGSAPLAVWRSPDHAVPALLTVALGIGGATAVLSVFSALGLRPLAFPREVELVEIGVPGPLQDDFAPACETIEDGAISSRSSKRFFDEGAWTPAMQVGKSVSSSRLSLPLCVPTTQTRRPAP